MAFGTTVAPARGAWIEINDTRSPSVRNRVAPARGAWIEMWQTVPHCPLHRTRPAWGAWIEMHHRGQTLRHRSVAPRMGRVD